MIDQMYILINKAYNDIFKDLTPSILMHSLKAIFTLNKASNHMVRQLHQNNI